MIVYLYILVFRVITKINFFTMQQITRSNGPPNIYLYFITNKLNQMKKVTFLVFPILLFAYKADSQITKGNWLIGGSVSFSSTKFESDISNRRVTNIQANGNAGYFLADKFVAGLRPSLLVENNKSELGKNVSTISSIGPFMRYYVLPVDHRINLLFETGYLYGTGKVSSQKAIHSNTFFFAGGPVVFLNTSVGLELLFGYSATKVKAPGNDKRNIVQIGLGLQYHLEKE